MRIEAAGAGKRFNREWIFRKADLVFESRHSYAITGPNGSGKSTLLQCIGGMIQLTEGSLKASIAGKELNSEDLHRHLTLCAPYLDLIEEMSLREFLLFHQQFKPFLPGITVEEMIEELGLQAASDKQIRFFSSGMKQRVKLAQAIFSDAAIILLDEPCSNLDANGIGQYHSLIQKYTTDRLVIVCSNDETEYRFCEQVIAMTQFK